MWKKIAVPHERSETDVSATSDINVTVKEALWTIRRAALEVFLPVLAALVCSLPVAYFVLGPNSETPDYISAEVRPPQLPVTRDLTQVVRSIDNRNFLVTVTGRQVADYEKGDLCEYLWAGRISEVAAQAGTVFVEGHYLLDDFVARQEYGVEEAIADDLSRMSIQSDNCAFDALSVDIEEL